MSILSTLALILSSTALLSSALLSPARGASFAGQVIDQVMPDRFFNEDTSNDFRVVLNQVIHHGKRKSSARLSALSGYPHLSLPSKTATVLVLGGA